MKEVIFNIFVYAVYVANYIFALQIRTHTLRNTPFGELCIAKNGKSEFQKGIQKSSPEDPSPIRR